MLAFGTFHYHYYIIFILLPSIFIGFYIISESLRIVYKLIPDSLVIKTATITKKSDSYYVSFSIKYKSVNSLIPTKDIKLL